MIDRTKFPVYDKPCKNCLFSRNRIVDSKRAKEIIEECKVTGKWFICHVASMEGEVTCCKAFFDNVPTTVTQLAKHLGVVTYVKQPDES